MMNGNASLRDLGTDLLRCFVAVADAGGFTAAGERIGLTQSGISVRIRRLEDRLETRLFERTSRALHLTPDGEVLLGYARRMLDLNDEAVRRLRHPAPAGTLRLGLTDYFIPGRVPYLLARFRRHFPRVHLEVLTGIGMQIAPAFERGDLDIVVMAPPTPPESAVPLVTDAMVWAAGSRAGLSGTPLTLAALPDPCQFRRAATESLDAAGIPWEISYTSSSIGHISGLLRAGLAVSALPRAVVGEGLREIGPAEGLPALPSFTMSALARRDMDPALRRAFMSFLLEETQPGATSEAAA
jgi:DNA-binding transcriptional LysR family regulator